MEDGASFVWVWDKRTRQLVELWHFPRGSQLYEAFRSKGMLDHGLAFAIRDVGPLLPKLLRLGAKMFRGIDVGDVRLNIIRDPDGHYIEILSWPRIQEHINEDAPLLGLVLPHQYK